MMMDHDHPIMSARRSVERLQFSASLMDWQAQDRIFALLSEITAELDAEVRRRLERERERYKPRERMLF